MFQYEITPLLLKNIKQIASLITKLNQKKFPQVVLLDLEKEAEAQSSYSSTSIEGNPLPLTEVKKLIKNSPKKMRDTEREVLNYNKALLWIKSQLVSRNFQFNIKLILQLHNLVTKDLLLKSKSGKYRNEPVFVNDPKKRKTIYWPPDHQDVTKLMQQLVDFVTKNRGQLDPIILAGIFHKQFVIIHPFIDGNGRTVRLATKAILADLGIDTFHLFSFENYYNQNISAYFEHVGVRGNYYDLDKKISFTSWLEYFSGGILDELLRVQKILENTKTALSPTDNVSAEQQKIITFLEKNGHIQDKDYAKITLRAKATRALDFKKLVELGLIERISKGPATYYILKNTDKT